MICCTIFGLFSGQPLVLLGSTGPVYVFEKILYQVRLRKWQKQQNVDGKPTKNKTHVCKLSGVSTRFQVYRPSLQVMHQHTRVNGANFVIKHK